MENTQLDQETEQTKDSKPDETSGLLVDAKIKIFDPETGEVMFEERA